MAFSIIGLCTYYPQVPDNPGSRVTLSCMSTNYIRHLLTSPTSSAPSFHCTAHPEGRIQFRFKVFGLIGYLDNHCSYEFMRVIAESYPKRQYFIVLLHILHFLHFLYILWHVPPVLVNGKLFYSVEYSEFCPQHLTSISVLQILNRHFFVQ